MLHIVILFGHHALTATVSRFVVRGRSSDRYLSFTKIVVPPLALVRPVRI